MVTSKDSTDLSCSFGGFGAAAASAAGVSPVPAPAPPAPCGRAGSNVKLSKGRRKKVEPVFQVSILPSRDHPKLSAPISVICTVGTAGENRLVEGASPPTC